MWDATNDTTLQQTVYYASGLPMAVSSGQSTQPYKYNGKEFIEMHGMDVTDLGFRSVHNARGRFDNMDPLCEQAYHSSPYAISANNPVNNVDVLGLTPIGLNYTEVKNGKITKHEETGIYNGDYRIMRVNDDGTKTCIGVEREGETYSVDDMLCFNYILLGGVQPTPEQSKEIYENTYLMGNISDGFEWIEGMPIVINKNNTLLVVSLKTLKYVNIMDSELQKEFDFAYNKKNFPNSVSNIHFSVVADIRLFEFLASMLASAANPISIPIYGGTVGPIRDGTDYVENVATPRLQLRRLNYYKQYGIIK